MVSAALVGGLDEGGSEESGPRESRMDEPVHDFGVGRGKLAWFDDQLIFLDIKKDKYAVLSRERSSAFPGGADHIAVGATMSDQSRARKLIVERDSLKRTCSGVSSNCWTLDSRDVSFTPLSMVARALMMLHSVHGCAQAERLAGLDQFILRRRSRLRRGRICGIDKIIGSLNGACIFYPKKTKCLEWSVALVALGFEYGFDLRLLIGVQNRPFYAHAWVQLGDKVIGDDQGLPGQLAVIHTVN
jgi:hypothetical protein